MKSRLFAFIEFPLPHGSETDLAKFDGDVFRIARELERQLLSTQSFIRPAPDSGHYKLPP